MRVAGRAGFGRRAGLLRLLGVRGLLRRARRIGAGAGMLALAVPLAWPSGAGGQHLSLPSAGSVRSGLVRLADFVTGDGPPALVVPEQQSGTGSLKPHIVSASASRNVKHATGHAPGEGAGQLPAWTAHAPSGAPGGTYTSGPAFTGFNPATSTQMASGTTATSYLFKNADGSYTRQIYAGPVNYQTPSGSWAPIDETLAQGTGSRWRETANSPAASFAAAGDDKALGTLANADGSESVSLALAGAGNVAGAVSGPSVTYAGILPGTGLTQTATATGIGESLTLSAAGAPASWVFPMTLKGLTATLDRGSVDLADSAGTVVYVIGPATVWSGTDAAAPGSRDTSQPAWKMGTYNGAPALELTLDAAWLGAPGRVLPIIVGWPVTAPAAAGSTYAESVNGTAETADNSAAALLPSGTATGGAGTFRDIDFVSIPPLGGLPAGEHVTAASLNLFDAYAAQCATAESVSAYQVTGARPGQGPVTYPGPASGPQDAQWTGVAPPAACSNTAGDPGQGGWISLGFGPAGLALLNAPGHGGTAGWAFAVAPSLTDPPAFKQFDSASATAAASAAGTAPPASPASPAGTPSPSSSAAPAGTPSPASSASPSGAASPASTAVLASVASRPGVAAPAASAGGAPYLQVTLTTDTPPQIDSQYPPDNYNAPTLTPELQATGHDPDGQSVQYRFRVYSPSGTLVADSQLISSGDWTVPSGDLAWGQSYYWTVQDYDGTNYSPSPQGLFLSTPVPQPLVTSELSQNGAGPGFDSQTGDWTTSATDAQVATVGPALEITRDYNSEDPRISGAFGAGWSSVLDMKVGPGQGGPGTTATEAVTYPDGEDVAFGLTSSGAYAAPPGRYATLAAVSGGFTLTDKNDTVYTFTQALGSGGYGITSIADALGRTETFGYNGSNQITAVTSASGRKLTISWTAPSGAAYPHVTSVVTDDATAGDASTAQDWTYTYSGDQLATACPPASATACTAYSYTPGSDYPAAVLDSRPASYWRLDESSGSTAASSVLLNEGTDNATYSGTSLGSVSGPLPGSTATSAGFNGASAEVTLPSAMVSGSSYQTISLWFKSTTPNAVLYSYQAAALSAGSTTANYVPALYIGSDGKLNAEVWNGTAAPITTSAAVDDGNWHNAVLTVAGTTQVLYLDGVQAGSPLAGTVKVLSLANHYVGSGFIGGPWPDEPHNGSAAVPEYFTGHISDVSFWTRPLTAAEVTAMHGAATRSAALVTKVTRPSGSVYAQVSYDPLTGRVTNVTDDNGGTWQVPAPQVAGSSQVWVASVLGAHPKDYWRLNDTGGSEAQNLMNCSCDAAATYYNVTEGVTGGPFTDSTVTSFNGTSSYLSMPSADENTTGPGSIGLWFKTTRTSEVLYSTQNAPVTSGTSASVYVPSLYVGSDGKLNGEFWIAQESKTIRSSAAVNDGKWHYAVLAAGTSTQSLYLDGVAQGTASGALLPLSQPNVAVGSGILSSAWPDSGVSAKTLEWFTGDIAELAWYPAQLTAAQVTAQWDTSQYASGLTPVQATTVTDPGNNTLTWTYDLLNGGRVLSQTDANGYTTTYGYDTGGFQDETTLAGTYVTETGYDPRGNMVSRTTCQDQAANECSTSYWTYYPNDTSSTLSADPRNDMMLTYADGRSAAATDTTYQTTYAYNASGDLTSKTTPPVTGFPSGRTTTYAYTDGSTTTGGYNGAVPPKGLPYQVTTRGGAVTTTLYYADGDVAKVTDPDGQYTVYAYDGLGRKTSQTVYSDSFSNGLTTTYAYDANGRLTTQTDPAVLNRVTDATHTAQATTSYDADGNVKSQVVTDLTGGDASRTVTRTYNGYDQLASETDAANATTNYTYDPFGNVASKTDPDGNVTDYTYDGDGNLLTTSLENYTGSRATNCPPSSGPLTEESRSYNPAGWLASVTDAMCNVTGYSYTDNGLVSSVSVENPADPTGSTWFSTDWYAYDGAGNVTEHWTNNGYTDTTYTLDAAGRVTGQELNSGLYRTTSITYTPDDQQASVTQTGPDGVTQQTSYTYDPAGNMLSQSVADPGAGGPAAWFPLTQSSGTSVPDSAAGGQPATAAGVTWSGSAAQFAGTSGQQVATAGPAVDTTGSFTVAAWVNLAGNTSSDQAVAAQAAGVASGFSLKYSAATGGWEFTRPLSDAANPSGWATAASASAAATGTWTFLTGTYDANTGTVTLYVNGAASGSTATDTSPIPAHGPLLVGADKAGGTTADFLDGQAADVQVYPRALSAAQVSSLYGLGQGGGDVTTGKLVTTWTRDQRGLPTSMTSSDGTVTSYTYDEAGQLALTTGPMVTTETYGGTPVTAHPLTWTGYDTFGDVSETKDADGNVTTYGYDADGQQVSKTLPPYTPPGGSPITAVETTGYDGNGNVTSTSDGIGNTTTYKYDQLGDQVTATAPDNSVTTTAYDADMQPLSVTGPTAAAGPTGAQTQMTWDYLGRKATSTQVERYTGSGTAAYTTQYAYDDSSTGGGFLSKVTSPDGVTAQYAYDPAGELAQVTDGAGNATNYSYDSLGRQVQVTYPDSTSQVTAYDAAGNPTSVQQLDASGHTLTTTSATFDGEGDKLSATDANGNTTTFTYDRTGLVSQEVQPVSASSGITTSFGYDPAGNQTRYTDGNGNSWWNTYNSWGLQQLRVEPATSQYSSTTDSTYQTAYDGDGRPATVTEPGGVTVTDSYNNLEELTGQSGAGADAATPTRSFGYDAAGNLTSASTTGTNATSESFTYNDRGEVLTASGSAGSTSYGYNGDGQVTSVADAAGTTSYGYDSAGRLASLADPATGITATYSYNTSNQVTGISYGSGRDTQSLGYDSLHRLTSETLKTGSGATVASVGYGYNPGGQVTSMTTAGLAGPSSSTYTYDHAGRLTSWNNGTTTTNYGYDGNGNLTQNGTKTYSYDARDELTSDGTNSYTYTARGTPSSESSPSGSVAVTFDAYSDQATAGTQSYTYDALGRLTADAPTGSGTGNSFSYAGKTGTIAADGAATYTWDPSGTTLVGTGAAGGGPGVLALTDAHGDALGQFAPAGTAMTGSRAFDPWGTVTATSGSLSGGLGFQGAWADPATGKDLMGARWYNPAAGDFTSADSVQVSPVPDPAAANPYAYAADDPVIGTDPTGHLVAMLPDGGNYYRTAPPPARPVTPPPLPPSYYQQQAVQAFTTMTHSMGSAKPADAHKTAPAPKTAKAKPVTKPAQSSADPCAGNITACLVSYIRYNGGQLSRQGTVTLTGYHPGPANPGTCGTSICYNVLTGRALKPSVIPAPTGRGQQVPAGVTNTALYQATIHGIQLQQAQGVYYSGCSGRLFQLGACPSEWGAAGITPQQVKDSMLGAAMVLTSAIPVGDLLDALAIGDTAASAAEGSAATAEEASSESDVLANCGESFTAGTKVLLASGAAIPISQLRPGDRVLATNTKTGKTSPEAVTAVMVKRDTDKYDLIIRSGHRTVVIDTTRNHLFWDLTRGRWIKAGALKHGDHLRTSVGATATVGGGHAPADLVGWMWDISVPGGDDHDFYIDTAAAAVLVHNCPASPYSGGVYTLRDPETGAVVRTGRGQILAEREVAHARDPELSEFRFQVEYQTNDFNTQKGLERMLYDQYPEARAANGGFNFRSPLVDTDTKYEIYMQAARDYLAGLEGE